MLLAEDGKINLTDDIRTHLPELRDYKVPVTINAMLGHFSGMGDYASIVFCNDTSLNINKLVGDLRKVML